MTLLVSGGSGKTRLAQEVIQRLREPFAGRVGCVDDGNGGGRIAGAIWKCAWTATSLHPRADRTGSGGAWGRHACCYWITSRRWQRGAAVVRELLERVPNPCCCDFHEVGPGPDSPWPPIAPLPVPKIMERQKAKGQSENAALPVSLLVTLPLEQVEAVSERTDVRRSGRRVAGFRPDTGECGVQWASAHVWKGFRSLWS